MNVSPCKHLVKYKSRIGMYSLVLNLVPVALTLCSLVLCIYQQVLFPPTCTVQCGMDNRIFSPSFSLDMAGHKKLNYVYNKIEVEYSC